MVHGDDVHTPLPDKKYPVAALGHDAVAHLLESRPKPMYLVHTKALVHLVVEHLSVVRPWLV